MKLFKILSVLLSYPEVELVEAVPAIREELQQSPNVLVKLDDVLNYIVSTDLITQQENYVKIFDRNPSHSLHLFEHVYGEDRARGQAMVDLIEEYQRHGLNNHSDELPDYVPLFLEFLSVIPETHALNLLGEAIDVLAHLGQKLTKNQVIFASIFEVLLPLSPVEPKPLVEAPIRDMDEALEKFGPSIEGIEPLLKPSACQTAPTNPNAEMPVKFYGDSNGHVSQEQHKKQMTSQAETKNHVDALIDSTS